MLAYERHLIHRCKNINSYEDSFVYEKYFIYCCKKINWYEDSFAVSKNMLYTSVKTLVGMKICLHMKDI